MPIEKSNLHMPEAPGQEPWTKAERLFREEALRMELDPPAGLEAHVFGALDQLEQVTSTKKSWWTGGAAVVAALALAWLWMPSGVEYVPEVTPRIQATDMTEASDVEESTPVLMQRNLDEALSDQPAADLDVREVKERKQAHVSNMEVLDASELPSVDDLNAARELSVIGQAPKQEVRKAKVEVHSKH